jgi:hypothetical protein
MRTRAREGARASREPAGETDKWEALAQAEADYWTARDREEELEARLEAIEHRDRFRHEIEEAARWGDADEEEALP